MQLFVGCYLNNLYANLIIVQFAQFIVAQLKCSRIAERRILNVFILNFIFILYFIFDLV